MAALLSGCPDDDDDSAIDDDDATADDDDATADDDDATADDDDATADDDDATADDDDATADDDDATAAEVATINLSADPAEADTRGTITLTLEALDAAGDPVSFDVADVALDFTTATGDPAPEATGLEVESVTAGTTSVVATLDGVDSAAVELSFVAAAIVAGDVVINELLAAPPGDANGDGSTETPEEDTFVEFVSVVDVEVDLEGAGVFESELISVARHTFDAGDTLLPGHAVVVFGGGSPAVGPTNSIWVAADNLGDPGSPGYLHLDPLGDVIELRNAAGDTVVELGYGNKVGGAPNANIDQSITLDPQLTGTTYSPHSDVASDPAALYSPGTLADGATF